MMNFMSDLLYLCHPIMKHRPNYSFTHSGYFYSTSSSLLLLRESPLTQHGYCVRVSRRSATGHCEWRTCPRSLRGG